MKAQIRRSLGFTLVEILAVLAVISVLATAGYQTATSVRETAREQKLESDVASLNSAVQVYEATGGSLVDLDGVSGGTTEEKILNKLKVKGDDEALSKFNGISGSVVDARIAVGDTATSGKRASWDEAAKRFVVLEGDGVSGIREFVFSDEAAGVARGLDPNSLDALKREGRAMDAANVRNEEGKAVWVWDYTAASVSQEPPISNPDTSTPAPTPAATPTDPDATPTPTPMSTPVPPATPTPTPTSTPSNPDPGEVGLPNGVLVSSITLYNNAQINGSVTLADYQSTMGWYDNWTINGNLYLPGNPDIYKDWQGPSQLYTLATDAMFSSKILGKQFDESGPVIPQDPGWSASPRVIDPVGGATGSKYTIIMGNANKVEGKVYRGVTAPSLPTVTFSGTINPNASQTNKVYNGSQVATVSPNDFVNITTQQNAQVTLLPGNYKNLRLDENSVVTLGVAGQTTEYTFESISLFTNSQIKLAGPVVITINQTQSWNPALQLQNNSTMGDRDNPDWLTLKVYTSGSANQNNQQVGVYSGTSLYGLIVAPKGRVAFYNDSHFKGSVTAYHLYMEANTGADILFTESPVQ